jgi:hypothetical protein
MASKFDDTDTSSARVKAKMVSSFNSLSHTTLSTKTSAVPRHVWADSSLTPHRVDAYSVVQSQHLERIPTASLREQVDIPEGEVKKISVYESPEKWIIKNPEIGVSLRQMRDDMRPQLTAVALRILLDAFLKILGYEPAKWTAKETAEWRAKGKDAKSIRGKVVMNSEGKLLKEGFTEREIRVLFAAYLRTEINDSAHQMKLSRAASLLGSMEIDPIRQEAVKKAFRYVCGIPIDEVDPESKDILTTSGIMQSGNADEHLFEGEDEWTAIGKWD